MACVLEWEEPYRYRNKQGEDVKCNLRGTEFPTPSGLVSEEVSKKWPAPVKRCLGMGPTSILMSSLKTLRHSERGTFWKNSLPKPGSYHATIDVQREANRRILRETHVDSLAYHARMGYTFQKEILINMVPVKHAFHLALLLFFFSGIISCSSLSSKMTIEPMEVNAKNNKKALVFVHGVLGSDKDTWTNTSSSVYWPRLLAKEVRDTFDVYTASYATSLDESPVIYQLGRNLNEALIKEKVFPVNIDDTTSKYEEVIFIAHSMGNLVVQSALLAGDSALELKVPLLISIAAPWNGSDLADKAAFLFVNRQFRDMVKVEKNSFLQLLQDVWGRRKFPILITCAAEGKDYSMWFVQARVVTQASATQLCDQQEREEFKQEDHMSIVKPQDVTSPIHRWLIKQLNANESKERPWKLRRWIGEEEKSENGERIQVCEIRIAGKEFHESNILMQMMVLVLEDRIKQLGTSHCAGSQLGKGLEHRIKIQPLYDHGDGPTVISEMKNQNIDIYAEYSGALLYSHLNEIPVPPPPQSDEESKHEPKKINEFMSSPKHPAFHKMKLLPRFGFDSGIELVMLRSTAEQLQMLHDGNATVAYEEIAVKGGQLAFLGDRDLFKRRDALGGLKAKFPQLNPKKEVSLYHEEIYEALDKSDCQVDPQSEYCENGLRGAVAIGFKTDPQANDPTKYVKIVASGGYELPKHWASPMVHKFLDHAFPELEPTKTLERLKDTISNDEMLGLVKKAQELEKESQNNEKKCQEKQSTMTSEDMKQQGKCDYKEEFRNNLRDLARKFLIGKDLIMRN